MRRPYSRPVIWTVPSSPAPQPDQPWSTTVDGALLTGSARGRLHTVATEEGPRRWMTGAVHDANGVLVPASLLRWSGDRAAPVAADPKRVPVPEETEHLEGTWRYAGNWAPHFGHFFIEVLTTLWGPVEERTGLVLHRRTRSSGAKAPRAALREPTLSAWQREFLRLAGAPDAQVRVVLERPVRVDRLVVPSRPVLLKLWAAPEAVEVWRRVSDAVGAKGKARRVFLSRSLFHEGGHGHARSRRSEAEWDAHLDQAFAAAGFAVVHPQRLSLTEQLAAVRGAKVLAGASGSALHLSAFARPGTRVLEIGDERSPDAPMPTQQMIDAACGHPSAFVSHLDRNGLQKALKRLD